MLMERQHSPVAEVLAKLQLPGKGTRVLQSTADGTSPTGLQQQMNQNKKGKLTFIPIPD